MSIADVLAGERRWTVIEGDALEAMAQMPGRSVSHVLTDPPYEAEAHTKFRTTRAVLEGRMADESIDFGQIDEATRSACGREWCRLSCGWVLAFCQAEGVSPWRTAIEDHGGKWRRAQIWIKPDSCPQFTGDRPAPGYESIATAWCGDGKSSWHGGGARGIYTFNVNVMREGHPTQKPVALMLRLVELFTDPNDLILDPFAGSGTTGVACLRLGRRFIGIEKDKRYADLAWERLAAEESQSTLSAARAGQLPLLGGSNGR